MNTLLILVLLTNLRLLASSRLGSCIRWVAGQGVLLGFLAVMANPVGLTYETAVLAAGAVLLKAGVFPWLLFRALRQAEVRREVEPYVGFNMSLLIGLAMLGISFWLGGRLPLSGLVTSPLLVPVAFFSMLVGLFLIVSRKKAITQVLGYLVMENGIYVFGVGVVHEAPMFVELGILLDLFVAVFVMGIAIFHIAQDFDHIDTDRLARLKD
jgi:hydrogenase-4 component E